MVIEHLDVDQALEKAKRLLKKEQQLPSLVQSSMNDLVFLVTAMVKRLGINSRNSSEPPSQDPNRERKKKEHKQDGEEKRKPGGQVGYKGKTLEKVETPDAIEEIAIDWRTIPACPG